MLITSHEWMFKSMISAVKAEGYHPEEISFHAGWNETESHKDLFFEMHFSQKDVHGTEEIFSAFWDPDMDGREIYIDFRGKR